MWTIILFHMRQNPQNCLTCTNHIFFFSNCLQFFDDGCEVMIIYKEREFVVCRNLVISFNCRQFDINIMDTIKGSTVQGVIFCSPRECSSWLFITIFAKLNGNIKDILCICQSCSQKTIQIFSINSDSFAFLLPFLFGSCLMFYRRSCFLAFNCGCAFYSSLFHVFSHFKLQNRLEFNFKIIISKTLFIKQT
jgi:hypothetical protein